MKDRKKSKGTGNLVDEQQRILEKIGERIRALRKEKGYTNADIFAFENKIDRTQYGRYERGLDMQISSLVKVLLALNVTFKEFFADGFGDGE